MASNLGKVFELLGKSLNKSSTNSVGRLSGKSFVGIAILSLSLSASFVYAKKVKEQKTSSFISNQKQLTFSGAKAGEGYFSADGEKMIFQSERDSKNPFYQMYIVDLKTGKTNRISTGVGKTTCGWIHPDMKTVLWSSTHHDPQVKQKTEQEFADRKKAIKQKYSWSFDEQYEIYTSDLSGKKLKRLTNSLGYDAEASYSNDGQWIAFASNRKAYDKQVQAKWTPEEKKIFDRDPSYFMDIYIMKADGTNVRQLTTTEGYDGGPFFSADSKKITWRKFTPDGSKAEIFTMNIDGTDQKAVTRLNAMSWAPFFHPSGKYIIFTSSVLGYHNFELFIVDSDGAKDPVRVTYEDGFDGLPTFSPDGTKVSWTRRNDKGESQIYWADWNHNAALKSLGLQSEIKPVLADLTPDISKEDSKKIIEYLASESMGGRMTGSPQEEIYMQRLTHLFSSWGLDVKNHKFEFVSQVTLGKNNKAAFKGSYSKELKNALDYQVISNSASGKFAEAPLVFAGYGIQAPSSPEFAGYNSYTDLDVKGKWVLLLEGEPLPDQRDQKKYSALIPYSGMQHKITVAKNLGAVGVVFVPTENRKDFSFQYQGQVSETTIPVLKITQVVFENLAKLSTEYSKKSLKDLMRDYNNYTAKLGFMIPSAYLTAEVELQTQKAEAQNLVAVLNPTHPRALKNKALLIGAHGDHLGFGQTGSSLAKGQHKNHIHYGADDNASGVAGVIELAHYFSLKRKNLNRPVYFAIWSGEELGVLGSSDFVKNFKKYYGSDFEKTFLAGLNMDMIGRLGSSMGSQNTGSKMLYVQGLGSAKGWAEITEQVAFQNKDMNLQIVTNTDPYLPTDAMSIYLGKVPSISFFTGAHTDYHTPTDTADKINYEGLVAVINTVKSFVQVVDTTSQIDKKLTYNHIESQSKNREGRQFRIFLGTIPDYTQEGIKGVKISGVSKNSPAEKAGLKNGDVITEFDKVAIDNIYDYVYTLQTVKPNIKTSIKIIRDSKTVELEIQPTLKE